MAYEKMGARRQTDSAASGARRLDAVFAALADPTRRAIIENLSSGEARVTEIAKPFDMSLNAISKHIRVLEGSGLIRRRVEGREHILALELRAFVGIEDWIERMRRHWNARLDAMERLLGERQRSGARRDKK